MSYDTSPILVGDIIAIFVQLPAELHFPYDYTKQQAGAELSQAQNGFDLVEIVDK